MWLMNCTHLMEYDEGGRHPAHPDEAHGHSHVPSSILDTALISSAEGIRAVKWSLVVLFVAAIAQGIIVWLTGSAGLLADTIHNFADALTAVPLWIAFRLSSRTPTRHFPYGLNRTEDLAGLMILAIIMGTGLAAAYQSFTRLIHPVIPQYLWVGIAGGVIGFLGNELVAVYRIRIGRMIGSAALVVDGQHARMDGLTSLAAVAGLIGVLIGYPILDSIAGLVISVAIMWLTYEAGREVVSHAVDGIEPDVLDHIEHLALHVEGVHGVAHTRARWCGHVIQAETTLLVDPSVSVMEGHRIAERVRHALLEEIPQLADALIHCDPAGVADAHAETSHHFQRSGHT